MKYKEPELNHICSKAPVTKGAVAEYRMDSDMVTAILTGSEFRTASAKTGRPIHAVVC